MTRSVRGSDAIVAHVPWHLTRTDGRHPAIRHEKSTARPAAGACEKREGATGVAVNHSAAAPRTPAAPSTDRDCRRCAAESCKSKSDTTLQTSLLRAATKRKAAPSPAGPVCGEKHLPD